MAHPWIKGEGTPREEMPAVQQKIKRYNAKRRLKKAGTAVIGSIRWRKLAQSNKQNNPQSSKQINEQAQAAQDSSLFDAAPAQNNFMAPASDDQQSRMSESDSLTPNHDASAHVHQHGGFNEVTQEMDMRSEESKEFQFQ